MGLFRATLSTMRHGLGRTRSALSGIVRPGRAVDTQTVDDIEAALLKADVGVTTTEEIISALRADVAAGRKRRSEDVQTFLESSLRSRLGDPTPMARPEHGPLVMLVAGVNGVGKTTSVAKIAHAMAQDGRRVLLAAADTFRAGAVAQLVTWGERLGIEVIRGAEGADPAAVTWDATEAALARQADVLIVDTAGRMHTEDGLMRQLEKIRGVLAKRIEGAPHESLLVLDATQGQNALTQARVFTEAVDLTGIFLAKLDGTARGGIVFAIASELGVPVKFIGVGERPEDVEAFDPDTFVEALFE